MLEDRVDSKVLLRDARNMFLRHVDEVLYQEREISTVQSLLHDYKCIVGDFGYEVGDMRSSYLKEIIVEEYGTQIGFKDCAQKTQSDSLLQSYKETILI